MSTQTKVNNAMEAYEKLKAANDYDPATASSSSSGASTAYENLNGIGATPKGYINTSHYNSALERARKSNLIYDAITKVNAIGNNVTASTNTSTARTAYDTAAALGVSNSNLTAAGTELNKAEKAKAAIAAINGMGTPNWNTDYNSVTTAKNAADSASAWTKVSNNGSSYISTYNTAITQQSNLNTVHNTIAALPAAANVTLAHKSAIESARSAYNALSSYANLATRVGNASTLTDAETAYRTLKDGEIGRIVGLIDAVTVDASTDASITAAENATNSSTNGNWSNSDISGGVASQRSGYATTISNARGIYTLINPVYNKIILIPANAADVTAEHETVITNARSAYDALASTAYGDLRSYLSTWLSRLTDAETALEAFAGPSVAEIEAAIEAFEFDASSDAGIAALEEYVGSVNWDDVDPELQAVVEAVRKDYAAVHPVYEAIEDDLPAIGDISLASGDAAIATVEAAFEALSSERQAMVSNSGVLDAARAAFDALKPTVSMSGTLNSAKIQSNLYFTIPTSQVNTAEQKAAFKINIAGTEYSLTDAAVTAQISGDKTHFILHVTSAAKDMSKSISYSITSTYNGGTTYKNSTTSVAAYATALLSYTDANADKQEKVRTAAQRMLEYGRTAEIYFNVNGDNSATISAAAPTATVVAPETPFDDEALKTQLGNSVPVGYLAMSVTCKSDTTLSFAFFIHTGYTKEQAKTWMESNMTLGGSPVSVTESVTKDGTYLIVSKQNVPVTQIRTSYNFVVAGTTYKVSVLDYLVKAQAKAGNANLNALAKAMYAYALAAEALG